MALGLKVLALTSLVYLALAQNCSNGRYGSTCFCTFDFPSMLKSIGVDPSIAFCKSNPVGWSYPASLNLKNGAVNLGTDHLEVTGNLTATSSTSFFMILDQRDQSASGLIDVTGLFIQGSAVTVLSVRNANDTTNITYTIARWTTAVPASYPDKLAIQFPTVASDFRACRTIQSPLTPNFGSNTVTINPHLKPKPGWDCATGTRGDRSGIIVMAVLLGIHAICLLVFRAVTCKIVNLKERIWDVDI